MCLLLLLFYIFTFIFVTTHLVVFIFFIFDYLRGPSLSSTQLIKCTPLDHSRVIQAKLVPRAHHRHIDICVGQFLKLSQDLLQLRMGARGVQNAGAHILLVLIVEFLRLVLRCFSFKE